MSHAPEQLSMWSVEATPEQQAQPARCALAAGSASEFSSSAQNRWNSLVESESGNASGECAGEELLSDFREHPRYLELSAKVARGEALTNNERGERQGLIFNHGGKPSGFCVI